MHTNVYWTEHLVWHHCLCFSCLPSFHIYHFHGLVSFTSCLCSHVNSYHLPLSFSFPLYFSFRTHFFNPHLPKMVHFSSTVETVLPWAAQRNHTAENITWLWTQLLRTVVNSAEESLAATCNSDKINLQEWYCEVHAIIPISRPQRTSLKIQ